MSELITMPRRRLFQETEWVKQYGPYQVHVVKLGDVWYCDVRDTTGAILGQGRGWNLALAIRQMNLARTGREIVTCQVCGHNPITRKEVRAADVTCTYCGNVIR